MNITAADQFCGAGGFSTGLRWAVDDLAKERGKAVRLKLVAINHWPLAIETHKANHPDVDHICDELEKADPLALFPDGTLRLLISSPECTHFSRALGGKPRNWQSRATAKYIVKWANLLDVQDIIIENVAEFQTWGPLHRKHGNAALIGQPIPNRKGEFFRAFIRKLEKLGYTVEHRLLVCADYGDVTSRKRLFIRARKGEAAIRWPKITHAHQDKAGKLSRAMGYPIKPYRTAREIIDWEDLGQSIFNRKRPLADNTMRRIFAGLRKFSGLPFVLGQQSGSVPRSTNEPIPTVAGAGAISLVQPFLVGAGGPEGQRKPFSIDNPIGAISGTNVFAIVQPYLVKLYNNNDGAPIDEPVPTITAGGQHIGVAQPFLFAMEHPHPASPVGGGGVNARAAWGLAQPFVFQMDQSGRKPPFGMEGLMPTITSADAWGLAQPRGFIVPVNHGKDDRTHDVDGLVPTITSVDAFALATPFLVKFYGNEKDGQAITEPLGTVTGRDRFALCVPLSNGYAILDIFFRMLKPIELARAHSLGHYTFLGSRENVVKQIGNGVPSMTAKSLCYSALKY